MASASSSSKYSEMDIATLFTEYDTNHDGRIELAELRELCARLGFAMSEEGTVKVMEAIDKDKDGTVSPSELAAFLSSDSAGDVKLHGVEAYGVRAAMLARFAARSGTELVRRASSEMEAPVEVSKNAFVADFDMAVGDVPEDPPMRLQFSVCPASKAPPPPAEMSSGKGLALIFEVGPDGNAENTAASFNEMVLDDPPPLPDGVTLAAHAMDFEGSPCFAIVVDAPIADVPPEIGAMFGIDDIESVVEGLNLSYDTRCSKDVAAMASSDTPIVEGLALSVHGRVEIAHHIWNVLTQLARTAGDMGIVPGKAKPLLGLVPLYSLIYRSIRRYEVGMKIDSVDEIIDVIDGLSGAVPGIAISGSDIRGISAGAFSETIVSKIRRDIHRAPKKETLVNLFRTCSAVKALRVYVGPLAVCMDATGLQIPFLAEAANSSEEEED